MVTRFQLHREKWKHGCGNDFCKKSICLYRGDIPCDVLFIGEAPGERENSLKVPFVGPAGQLLDRIVRNSIDLINEDRIEEGKSILKVGYTNIVACMPTDEGGDKIKQPDEDQIDRCSPRLVEIIEICKPRLIICVGKIPEDYLDQRFQDHARKRPIPKGTYKIAITHPAAILRANPGAQPIMEKKVIFMIMHAVEDLLD